MRRIRNALAVLMAAMVVLSGVAYADQLVGDADGDSLANPTQNTVNATVAEGTTVEYTFSAHVKDTGNSSDNVFPGTLPVSVTRSGEWLDATDDGSPDSIDFTTYLQNKTGTVRITVPACTEVGTLRTMTVTLTGGTSTNGKTLGSGGNNLESYVFNITASAGTSVCEPVDPCADREAPATAPSISEPNDATRSSSGWYNAASGDAKFTVSPSTNAQYKVDGGEWTAYPAGGVTLTDDGIHSVVARNVLPASTTPACDALAGPSSDATTIKIDRRAPVVTPADVVANGWHYSYSADFVASDAVSGLAVTADATKRITVDAQSPNATTRSTASYDFYDAAGNKTTRTVSAFIDRTKPTVTPTVTGTKGDNDWYVGDVVVSWTIGSLSPVTTSAGCATRTVDADTSDETISCEATNVAGMSSDSVNLKRDATKPTISGAVAPDANDDGWHNTAPTVTFTCGDATSGVASCLATGGVGAAKTLGEGANQSVTGTAKDNAGNTETANVTNIDVDLTAPTVALVNGPTAATYYEGELPAMPTCTASDGLSGLAAPCAVVGWGTGIGEHWVKAVVSDIAGNTSETLAIKYEVLDDTSAPVITKTVTPIDGDNGWHRGAVEIDWTVTEAQTPSSLQVVGCIDKLGASAIATDQQATSYGCQATSLGGSASDSVSVKRDGTNPTINGAVNPTAADGSNGWYKTAPTVTFTCSDATSGLALCEAVGGTGPSKTLGEGANQSVTGNAKDNAGNTNSTTVSGLHVDLTDPTVGLSGGPENGRSYYFGSVPGAPTCTASDGTSGLADYDPVAADQQDCKVLNYSTAVGTHTVEAKAKDNAGRIGTSSSITYTVLAWTLSGFYNPVDMNSVTNLVKGGSTVPLKFEVFIGSAEQTSTSVVDTFLAYELSCSNLSGAPLDDLELYTSGQTQLRYDATGGQFIQNWQTPKTTQKCYRVVLVLDDGTSISANFKTK